MKCATQKQDRAAQLTKAAGCRCSSRVGRHFRRHSRCSRYTHDSCTHRSRLGTSIRPSGTRTRARLNNKQKGLHYYMYSPSLTLYSCLFTFIHLCRHCIHFLIQPHRQLHSHPLTSIVTLLIDIITSTDHLFRSPLLSPLLVLLIVSSGASFIR